MIDYKNIFNSNFTNLSLQVHGIGQNLLAKSGFQFGLRDEFFVHNFPDDDDGVFRNGNQELVIEGDSQLRKEKSFGLERICVNAS